MMWLEAVSGTVPYDLHWFELRYLTTDEPRDLFIHRVNECNGPEIDHDAVATTPDAVDLLGFVVRRLGCPNGTGPKFRTSFGNPNEFVASPRVKHLFNYA